MKTMTLHLDETIYEQLRAIAAAENRPMVAVVRAAIHEYVEGLASQTEFHAALKRTWKENGKLIEDLAAR